MEHVLEHLLALMSDDQLVIWLAVMWDSLMEILWDCWWELWLEYLMEIE